MFLLKKHIFFFSVVLFLRASSGVLNIIIQSVVLALDMDRLVSNTRLGNQLFFWLELLWSLSVLLSYLLSFCLDSAPWITLASFGWISLHQYHVFQKIYRLRVSFSFFFLSDQIILLHLAYNKPMSSNSSVYSPLPPGPQGLILLLSSKETEQNIIRVLTLFSFIQWTYLNTARNNLNLYFISLLSYLS